MYIVTPPLHLHYKNNMHRVKCMWLHRANRVSTLLLPVNDIIGNNK